VLAVPVISLKIRNSMSVTASKTQRRLHTFVCILLCISSWRGPVPVVHHHAQYNVEVCERHIDRFHAETAECPENVSDWHWHLAIPGDEGEESSIPVSSYPSEILSLACSVAIETDSGDLLFLCVLERLFDVDPSFDLRPEISAPLRSAGGILMPRTFLEFQRGHIAMSALTGVATV
jgi:hypothetical protein